MSVKRRADVLDPDFAVIRQQISKLLQQSLNDCKSFLLMVKSLYPSSIKLEMIEYELFQEYGDSTQAAEILCRLHENQKHLDVSQVDLLGKIIQNPTDKVCCEIFSKLTPFLQKHLAQFYMKQITNDLIRADSIIYLLNSKDVVLHPQTLPMLLSMANQSLMEGENTLRKNMDVKNHSATVCGRESIVKMENIDEGEEGEVMGGDDEDEFVDDLDTCSAEADDNAWSGIPVSVLNIFRFKITYELLPAAYKAVSVAKLDKNLIYRMSVTSLNFLLTYIAHIPKNPRIDGLEDDVFSTKKAPKMYIADCLKMVGHMLQWPVNNTFDFTSSRSPSALVQLTKDLFRETMSSCESSPTKKDTRDKMPRPSGQSLSHKFHPLAFQTLSVFWYTLIDIGVSYLNKFRHGIFENKLRKSSANRIFYFPLNLDAIFNLISNKGSSLEDEDTVLLKYIHEIWSFRKYSSNSYSFAVRVLDTLEEDIRPRSYGLCDYFALSGLSNNHQEILWACKFMNKYRSSMYRDPEGTFIYRFLQMLIVSLWPKESCIAVRREACHGLWGDFVKEFRSVFSLLDHNKEEKIHLRSICHLVPLTRTIAAFIVSKALASNLCHVSRETKDAVIAVKSACLACVLCQADAMSNVVFYSEPGWPPSFPFISEIMHSHWNSMRNQFLEWLLSPTAYIFDVCLLNAMFQLECTVGVAAEWSDRETFLSHCVHLVQCKSPDNVDSILEEFIHIESSNISSCLMSIEK
uniref:Uncharacterized protein n=1 Tax=Trichobilharzia regenti TaxID=157069 RepID=A0AA85JVC8_TRIRE|nr:unnamed protein product [Trichobilharzia regenti]